MMRTMELHSEIRINASAEEVWRVLTDFPKYEEWNPFIREAVGIPQSGERLTVRIKPEGGRGMTFRPRVLEADQPRRLRWLGHLGMPGLFDGEHIFEIETVAEREVLFIQRENFKGLLLPFFRTMLKQDTEPGFEAMNTALKTRVEGRRSR
jgi:hypothetical protein